jgi:hypothetical protein
VSRRARVAWAVGTLGVAAVLAAGYAAAGPAGLVAAATLAAAGVLVLARAVVPGQDTAAVRAENRRGPARAPAASTVTSAAEFPVYRKIATDLSWALVAGRHFEHGVRPMLARLAAALGRPGAVDLAAGPGPADHDGPGVDLATLDRIVTGLEGADGTEADR